MRRTSLKPKHPEVLMFNLWPVLASRFRKHCQLNGLIMSRVIEDLLIRYLTEEGSIQGEESLRIEEEMTK